MQKESAGANARRIAQWLVSRGLATDVKDVARRYAGLSRGKPDAKLSDILFHYRDQLNPLVSPMRSAPKQMEDLYDQIARSGRHKDLKDKLHARQLFRGFARRGLDVVSPQAGTRVFSPQATITTGPNTYWSRFRDSAEHYAKMLPKEPGADAAGYLAAVPLSSVKLQDALPQPSILQRAWAKIKGNDPVFDKLNPHVTGDLQTSTRSPGHTIQKLLPSGRGYQTVLRS